MRAFTCPDCTAMVFFENSRCQYGQSWMPAP